MFSQCSSLLSIDVSTFNTEKLHDMDYLFSGCSSLKSIDLSTFNTNKLTQYSNYRYAFANCTSLEYLDISSFDKIQKSFLGQMPKYGKIKCQKSVENIVKDTLPNWEVIQDE